MFDVFLEAHDDLLLEEAWEKEDLSPHSPNCGASLNQIEKDDGIGETSAVWVFLIFLISICSTVLLISIRA